MPKAKFSATSKTARQVGELPVKGASDGLKKRRRADITKHCTDAFSHRAQDYIHGKVDEDGGDNVGVQAGHEALRMVEVGVRKSAETAKKAGAKYRQSSVTKRSSKYRNAPQAKAKTAKYTTKKGATVRKTTTKSASRIMQTKRLKRQMIFAKKASAKTAAATAKVTTVKTKGLIVVTRALLAKTVIAVKAVGAKTLLLLLKIAIPVIIVLAVVAILLVIIGGIGQTAESALSIQADSEAITAATRHMSYLDTNFPRNNDEAFALIAYLTTMYGDFEFIQVLPTLEVLHNESRGSTVRSAINARLTPETQEFFNLLMEIRGGAQFLENPFDFPWLSNVTSHFGYRIHPIHGDKRLHQGLDIALPTGTPIRATHSGTVTISGDAGGFGLLVQIQSTTEDGRTLVTRYAHNSRNLVSAGQTVTAGQVIAEVGSTGASTGPHLHYEIWIDGRVLNPVFFIHTGEPIFIN